MEKSFFDKVLEITKLIPYGRVTSYGAIAKHLGATRSARMVGWALNHANKMEVPAHRVVNRHGLLTGRHHFSGTNLMQQLLENEGVIIKDHQVQEFQRLFWDPSSEDNT